MLDPLPNYQKYAILGDVEVSCKVSVAVSCVLVAKTHHFGRAFSWSGSSIKDIDVEPKLLRQCNLLQVPQVCYFGQCLSQL